MAETLVVSRPSSLGLRDYPHVFMPPKAIPVSRVGFQTIAAGDSYTLTVGQQILIPVQHLGWIRQIAVSLSAYGGGQVWSLLQAGTPIRDYLNVPASLGAPETPVERHIALFPQQPLSLTFKNGGGGEISVSWSLYGWYYSAQNK